MTSVTVSRFEQHVADLALNENEGFRRQFEVSCNGDPTEFFGLKCSKFHCQSRLDCARLPQIGLASADAQLFIKLVLNWRAKNS